jgi:hypothetical protein
MKDKLSQKVSSRWIPPVAALAPAAVTERESLLSAAALAITAKLDARETMTSLYYGVIKDIISQYSPYTLQSLTTLREDDQKAWAVHTGLMKNWTEAEVNDYLHLADFFRAHNISDEMHGYLKSFRYYEDMSPQNDGNYPERRREQCEAVIDLVEHMGNVMFEETTSYMEHRVLVPYIKDDKLRELILISEHRQKAVRLIKQRNILDADTIAGLIDTDANAPSLTEGVL